MRYIPRFILKQYKDNVFAGKFRGFALFYDIADFTPITMQFNKHGSEGAEELRAFLDYAFCKPIRIIESYGGFIVLFAGDAFCAIFPDETAKEALMAQKDQSLEFHNISKCSSNNTMSDEEKIINAVLKIKQFNIDKTIYKSSLGDVIFKIRQTVSYGDIKWQIFQNYLQNEYVFYGKALKDLAKLQKLKKDLIFSREAVEKIGRGSFDIIKEGGYIYKKNIITIEPAALEKKNYFPEEISTISGFINPKYQNEIPQPEIRSGAFCFASLEKLDHKTRQGAISRIQILADKYGGFIARYEAVDKGLAGLILFGMPINEERMLERVCRFTLEAVKKIPLLAIGLAKGSVYAGYTGSVDIKEYTALGNAVNLAARLMGKAGSGEILTDKYFYLELVDKFIFENRGSIQLKGIKNPVMIYMLYKQIEERRIIRHTELIGRYNTLLELKNTLSEALSKKENLAIYIYGIAGIGKSRLCNELMECFPKREFNRFFLYCDSVIQRSFEPIKQIIHQYFPADPEEDQQSRIRSFRDRWKVFAGRDHELMRIESIIASFMNYEWKDSIWSMLSPSQRSQQQKNAFLAFFAEIASDKPVIIFLDDGQWIDEDSKEYLQAIGEAGIRPVNMICSCRYNDDGSRPDLCLGKFKKTIMDLDKLDENSSREMIRHILKLGKLPQDTFLKINIRTMGNPFFIEQLCEYLKATKEIDVEGRMTGEPGPVASFQIRDIIGSRIDKLNANVRESVYNASVLGMKFNSNILSEMIKRPLESDLEAGKSNMIWKELEEPYYIFCHNMIKDTAYLRIMYSKQKNLHRLAAEAMESIHNDAFDEYAQEIAWHYERGNVPDKSALYYDKAGCFFRDRYNFTQGDLFLNKALKIRENIFGTEHPDTGLSLHNLALLHYYQGKYSEAEPLLSHSLQILTKALGKYHPVAVESQDNLAELYRHQGKYSEAESLYKNSLQIRKEALDKESPGMAKSLAGLANIYEGQGRYSEAEFLFKRSLAIKQKLFGKNHSDVASTLNGLAILYMSQGKYSEAEPLLSQSLQILQKALGKDHPEIAKSLNSLAGLYSMRGGYAKAELIYKRSLQIWSRSLGKDHPEVAKSLNSLALLYWSQGKYRKAETLYRRSLAISKKILGKDHPEVAKSLNNLANLYLNQGKYSEAEPLYMRSLEISKKVFGEEHPSVAASLGNLAILHMYQGQYAEAELLYKHSLQIREKALGTDHPDIADSKHNLAILYVYQGKYLEAEDLYRSSLRIWERALGKYHQNVAYPLNGLAELYERKGLYSEAELLYKRALEIAGSALGSDHNAVIEMKKNLNDCQKKIKCNN